MDEAHQEKRQAKAKLTREGILKLNSQQLTSFKDSVQKETENRKQCLQKTWGNLGPSYKVDKFALPLPIKGVEQPNGCTTEENFWSLLTSRKET